MSIQKLLIPHVAQVKLYVPATNTCACDVFGHHFPVDAFSTVFDHPHLYDMHTFFILSHFQERFQIYEFSMKTLKVVWTEGLNTSKCMHFQMKTH